MCTCRAGRYGLADFSNFPFILVILDIAVVAVGTMQLFRSCYHGDIIDVCLREKYFLKNVPRVSVCTPGLRKMYCLYVNLTLWC